MKQNSLDPQLIGFEAASQAQLSFDGYQALARAGGDPAVLLQFCKVFLQELPICLAAIRNALPGQDDGAAESAIRQLNSCFTVFGSGPILHTMESLAAALRGERRRMARQEWKCLEKHFQALVPQVKRLMLEMMTPVSVIQ